MLLYWRDTKSTKQFISFKIFVCLCVCTCVRFVGEKHEWKPKNRPIILQFICILLTYRVIFAQGHSLLYSGFLDGVEKSCTCCTN